MEVVNPTHPRRSTAGLLLLAIALLAFAGLVVLTVPAVAPAATGGAVPGNGQGSGGQAFAHKPKISRVICRQRCRSPRAASGARAQARSLVRVRGDYLYDVRTVLFLGAAGTRDDKRATPALRRLRYLDVRVPARARTGRIRVIDRDGNRSNASAAALRIYVPPPPRPRPRPQPRPRPRPTPRPSPGFIWPVGGPITSPFCERRSWESCHPGVDIGAPMGTPVHASAAGRVTLASWQGGYGNFICVAHAHRGLSTCYAHLSAYRAGVGERVAKYETIGLVGSTGNSTGPHLHFEFRSGTGLWGSVLNPLTYLPQRATIAAELKAALLRPRPLSPLD